MEEISVDDKNKPERIILKVVEEEMKKSYLDYAMSVIVSRALPDVRDGLKPVHRRILFAMNDMGMLHNRPYKKCARIVGEVLGKYHPHGDAAVYDSLVRMAQYFSLRYTLIDGHGNFGCFTKDTKIALTDGRNLSFKELVKEHKKGKSNYTFTINKNGDIEIAEIKNPRVTKKNQKIMKVILDNGEEIKCTLDHKFMLRNGTYKEAQHLKPDDSLTALSKFFNNDEKKLHDELGINIVKLNHKVKGIAFLGKKEDVYDITIENTHNFSLAAGIFVHNSVDGDSAAAMRYTEARMTKIAEELLEDIEKDTIKFVPNFDGSLSEPSVLPAKFPNLLVNGSSGIAVGMATNIPPHNIMEVCDAAIKLIENPNLSITEILDVIKGPDFPTAAIIYGRRGIKEAYSTGRGLIRVKAKTEVEDGSIIITELPYMVNKALLIEQIAELVKHKAISGISDLRDESDREGMRIVIELKKDANAEVVLNQLFKHSRMQITFGVNMVALVKNEPKTLNIKDFLGHYLTHRREIVRKRTEFDLKKAEERDHILQGLIIALNNIDTVINKIKASRDAGQAAGMLIKDYSLTEIQAKAILDMRLQRLASLEQQKIKTEHKDLLVLIEKIKSILASEQKILNIIKEELAYLRDKYGDERKTVIVEAEEEELFIEDLIEKEEVAVTITHAGYIKRIPINVYKQQHRGGKGIIAAGTREEDFVEDLFIANTHDNILFFTNTGQVYWTKVYTIPQASRQAKGTPIVNLLNLKKDEKITAFIPVKEFDEKHYLIMATKKGIIKKTNLQAYSRPRAGGIRGIVLNEGDELINVRITDGSRQIILATKKGMAVKFNEKGSRAVGRTSIGVIGIRLKQGDEVVGMVIGEDDKTLFTVTENGYGKRTMISEYRLINRGGHGVKNIICSERNGSVVSVKSVTDEDELMFISKNGIVIRCPAKDISVIGRNTQGVRVMKLAPGDKLVAAEKVINE